MLATSLNFDTFYMFILFILTIRSKKLAIFTVKCFEYFKCCLLFFVYIQESLLMLYWKAKSREKLRKFSIESILITATFQLGYFVLVILNEHSFFKFRIVTHECFGWCDLVLIGNQIEGKTSQLGTRIVSNHILTCFNSDTNSYEPKEKPNRCSHCFEPAFTN